MSDMFWENDGTEVQETNFAKAMREKAEADSKRIADLTDLVTTLTNEVRGTRVEKVVTSKGLDPKVVELMKATGTEISEQGAETFLKEYGALFKAGDSAEVVEAVAGEQPPDDVVPAEEQAALSGMAAAASQSIPKVGLDALDAQMKAATTAEDLLKLIGASAI